MGKGEMEKKGAGWVSLWFFILALLMRGFIAILCIPTKVMATSSPHPNPLPTGCSLNETAYTQSGNIGSYPLSPPNDDQDYLNQTRELLNNSCMLACGFNNFPGGGRASVGSIGRSSPNVYYICCCRS